MINRRSFLKGTGCAAVAMLAPSIAFATAAKRPNVVIIVSDDQYEFGFQSGRPTTPYIDKIVQEGMYFSRAYTTAACTPTRYNILAGKYASSSKSDYMMEWVSKEGQYSVQWNTSLHYDDEPVNMPKTFQANGYFTGGVGKTHNNVSGTPEDVNAILEARKHFTKDSDPLDPEVNKYMKAYQAALNESFKTVGFDYTASIVSANLHGHPCLALAVHNQEWMTKGAVDFLEEASKKDKPFFLYFATTLEHGPHEKRRSLDEDPRKCPGEYLDEPISGYQPSREDVKKRAAKIEDGKLGSVMWLDDGIGAIMKKLKDMGVDDNTIVIFMTDHAVRGGKASCYEGGVNPPVAIRWPAGIKPKKTDALIHTVDYFPTLMELCNVENKLGAKPEGKSIAGILKGKKDSVRDAIYVEWGASRGVVTKQYKYIALRHPESVISREDFDKDVKRFRKFVKDNKLNVNQLLDDPQYKDVKWPWDQTARYSYNFPAGTAKQPARAHFNTLHDSDQLFDLKNDPRELNNLAYDPKYKDVLAKMQQLLRDELKNRPGSFGEFKKLSAQELQKWEANYKKYHKE